MYLLFLIFSICLCGCSQKSPEYFQESGRAITSALVEELQAIDDIESLLNHLPVLESLFDSLVDQMIEARKWQLKHKVTWPITDQDALLSDKLASELHRLMRIPLAGHFIEKSQQQALERLDAFEKKSGIQ